jgi:hypothetical protein
MKTVLQIEFSPGILEDREAILRRSGCRVMSVLGSNEAHEFDLAANDVGVVVIGHGAPREERQRLASFFREKVGGIRIVCLLRYTDEPFREANFNVPADNPPLWERTIVQASQSYH